MNVDEAAHIVMKFHPDGWRTTIDHFTVFYHGNGLYSIRDSLTNAITLIYAETPKQAINKIKGELTMNNSRYVYLHGHGGVNFE